MSSFALLPAAHNLTSLQVAMRFTSRHNSIHTAVEAALGQCSLRRLELRNPLLHADHLHRLLAAPALSSISHCLV